MRVLKFVSVGLLLSLLVGCAFDGLRREPDLYPTFRYATGNVPPLLRDLPVSVDVSDCIEQSLVCNRGVFGGTSSAGQTPVREIVRREFERMIVDNFRAPAEGEREKAVIKVATRSVMVGRRFSTYDCEMIFDIKVVDPENTDVRPYFRGSFGARWQSRQKDDQLVPTCEYEVVRRIVEQCIDGILKERNSSRRLAEKTGAVDRRTPPELKSIRWQAQDDGRLIGACEVLCNDWEGFDADRWARTKILASSQLKLGIEPERVRVVYRKDQYDAAARRWTYGFVAFARAPLVLDYDPSTRHGECIADLGLLKLPATEASEKMKDFVLKEMRARGGAVTTTEGNLATRVRFDEMTSDVANNQIRMAFRLVY